MRIVAPRNLFIELIHEVRSGPGSPLRERENSLQFVKDLKGARLNGRCPGRVEELIVVFNHNVINLYFTANTSTMYTSYYDKVYKLL